MKWYTIRTKPHHEDKACAKIINQINRLKINGKALVPKEKVIYPKDKYVKIFPNYVFLEIDFLDEDTYELIRAMPETMGFLESSGKPTPLEPAEVERMLSRIQSAVETPTNNFEIKNLVRIKTPPFKDFTGVILSSDSDKQKLKVSINVFGREVPTEFNYNEVEILK